MRARSTLVVAVIGTTQTLAWASSYYLPAILAEPIASGLGVSKALFFGFFSASLLLQAALGPIIGPTAACSSSDAENNAKNKAFETPSPAAIGSARIAGR